MPTYEYACTACGHRLEAVQKFTDDALTECPDCGGKLRKIFAAPGIVLKGSGFYKTDTRAQDKRSNGSSSSGGSSGSESSSSSESKSESSTSSDSGSKSESSTAATPAGGEKAAAKDSKPAASTTAN